MGVLLGPPLQGVYPSCNDVNDMTAVFLCVMEAHAKARVVGDGVSGLIQQLPYEKHTSEGLSMRCAPALVGPYPTYMSCVQCLS